ncbi:PEGA domain-containing protein [Candidatus Daviesbacteria bacterium]|nr:PEGA domain-containing protein [Candidatus Daviesbacteria bacterium]
MKKTLIWILVLISLTALLLRFSSKWAETFLGIKQTSGISVLSQPSEAIVYLDNEEVGKTPYETKNLDVKTYTVKIQKDKAIWERKIQLTAGVVTVVNRDLVSDLQSGAGEILTLEKGKGITVISNPTGADVEVDGKVLGKTPLSVDLEAGEHTLLVSNTNYLKRSIRANLPPGFNLAVSVDLALSEADLTSVATPVITQTAEVSVKQTPTGFLRVRDKPNLSGKEIAQVKPGDILVLLEEQGAWDRVRLADGTEGFVSVTYVEKKKP